jgi:hypothetical protein
MTSGLERTRRAALMLPLLPLLSTVSATAGAARFDLAALMALLATRTSGEARFTEERTVSGLDSPLRAAGTLAFQAPDRFVRRQTEPRAESMEVAGNRLVWTRGGRTRQVALDAVPEAAALLEALRGTLAGDAAALQRHFDASVGGSPALWTLSLKPRDAQLANAVRGLQIAGSGADLRSVDLQMTGGDRALMLIEPVDARAPSRP